MSGFAILKNYGTVLEAELHADLLRQAGIPAMLQGPQSGMFGAGFSGASAQGVTLMVPANHLARAREVLGLAQLPE